VYSGIFGFRLLSNNTSTHLIIKNMKRNVEKKQFKISVAVRSISLTLMLALIVPAVSNAQTGKTNFAGNWTLNTEKSTMPQGGQGGGGGMRMGGGNFVATQEANLLTVVRTRTGQDGQPTTVTMKYTLDGKESVNTSPRGDSKSVAKWSADGKSLTIETTRTMDMNGESRTMTSTEVWVLTDAKTLTITSTRQSPNGDVKSNMVYDKK
jgi:dipeptidyl aminopeptidase/acylaminoacyl peptidase